MANAARLNSQADLTASGLGHFALHQFEWTTCFGNLNGSHSGS